MNEESFIRTQQLKLEAGYRAEPEPAVTPMRDTVEPPSLTEDELVLDPTFQEHAMVLYQDEMSTAKPRFDMAGNQVQRKQRYGVLTDKQDIAEWAVERLAKFNNSFSEMALDYSILRGKPPQVLQSFMEAWDSYDRTPTDSRQRWRGARIMATDPSNWMGFGLIGKGVAKGMSKGAVKSHLRNVARKAAPPAAVGAAEGAVFTGADAAVEESLTSQNTGEDFNWAVPMVYSGVGAVAGGGLGGAIGIGAEGVRYAGGKLAQKFKLYRGATHVDDPMATQNANGSPTLTDTPEGASQYGEVSQVDVNSSSPTQASRNATADDLAEQYDLDEQEISLLDGLGDGMLESPALADMLRRRGYDLLSYDNNGEMTHSVLQPDIVEGVTRQASDTPKRDYKRDSNGRFTKK